MDEVTQAIMQDPENQQYSLGGIEPLFSAPKTAKIVIVGQAPGLVAQETRLFWNDRSGERLRDWMGVERQTFYDSGLFAVLPMDFYYPGKGKSGDLPPRKDFAKKWHPVLLEKLLQVELFLLVGSYAQNYYLGQQMQKNLTETVKHFQEYLPKYFPLVHPSPRNQLWLAKNPWFEEEVVPVLQAEIARILAG
ncbi:uracil-DNA glycosylase family protein [Streptococcus sp.]|uniref:uracil-DNA glycosylase family protein n=1 Tax=Streptococcus sp. TaxID=1306 RepID=UPI00359F5C76